MSRLLAIPGLERTTPEFRIALAAMAADLGLDPDYMTPVMKCESNFRADAVNPMSNATGLIQFMPSTAARLGTSVTALARMSAEEQLPYVAEYFRPFVERIASAGDAYMVVFMPSHVGEDPGTTIATAPAKTYTQNQVFDVDRKGYITVADVQKKAQDLYDAAMARPLLVDGEDPGDGGDGGPTVGGLVGGTCLVLLGLWSLFGRH